MKIKREKKKKFFIVRDGFNQMGGVNKVYNIYKARRAWIYKCEYGCV